MNKEYYESQVEKFKEEGCKLPEAAALATLIEKCIKEKSYVVYEHNIPLDTHDVIVTFNFAGDPTFGLFTLHDGEPAQIISTPDGLMVRYL